ncbi:MAG: VOC family protein [Nocardia sp.]|nr:VOC family protein [Nocardia sp.]
MLAGNQFSQIAWVVDDLDSAVKQWQETTGIGPFFVGAHIGGMVTDARYRGRPVELDLSGAIAHAGSVQIELIQPHGTGPSPFREVYAEGEGGLHHVQAFVEDIEAKCRNYEEHGFEVVMTGSVAGQTPVAYVDTRPLIGCMTELMGQQGPAAQMFSAVAAIAADWDGSDPIRDMTTLMG